MVSRIAALVAVGLVLPAVVTLAVDDGDRPLLTFVRLIDSRSAGADVPFQAFDTHAANLFDLNRDGRMEIIAQSDNHRVYVIDPVSGRILAELYNNLPRSWAARDENGVAIGDVNGNGRADLVVVNSAGEITVFEVDPAGSANGTLAFKELWRALPDPRWMKPDFRYNDGRAYGGWPSADGAAFLADVEGNGKQWVFLQTDGTPGQYAFDPTGKFVWGGLRGDGNGGPVVDDLDGDGRLEVVFATDGGQVIVQDAKTGDLKWRYRLPNWPGSIPVHPLVADLDGDGTKEIVVGGRGVAGGPYSSSEESDITPENRAASHVQLAALDHRGKVLWYKQPEWANPLIYMAPVPHDVDGDGDLDLVFLDWNTIGHKPGRWERTGKANLFALEATTGETLWRTSVDSTWSNKAIALIDLDGDGVAEVLAEEQQGRDGLSFYSARDGKKKGWVGFPDGGWVASRGPFAADVDADGHVEVVVPVMRKAPSEHCERAKVNIGCREGALVIFKTQKGARVHDGNVPLFSLEYQGFPSLPGAPGFEIPPPVPVSNETSNGTTNGTAGNATRPPPNGTGGPGGGEPGGPDEALPERPVPALAPAVFAAVAFTVARALRRRS
ncbi:MAG TPA: VCBS repeat-containing protein [Candidatus Thermoplasmatota archaeon]|nr:VCBS repeat-containing protein [Candidatus Thermoplasmatota archaeon]